MTLDKKTFEGLLKIQCTLQEVASVAGCSRPTLQKWVKASYDGRKFEDVANEFREQGKASFRRMGFKLAEKNPSVWIFLAKNYLGMSDAPNEQQNDINVRVENTKAMSKAIDNAAKYMKKNNIDDASLADIPEAADYEEDIE